MSKKRIFSVVMVFSLVVVLSFAAAAKLVDGIYSLRGKEDDHGNYPSITIEVKNGVLAKVDYKEMVVADNAPKAKGKYPYDAYFSAVETLNKKAVEVNGDLTKLDAVAGATHTSETMKEMLFWAMTKAAKLPDRTYPAIETAADARGYKAKLVVTVKDGKVANIEYYEYNVDGNKPKTKGEYKWDAYFEACEALPQRVLKEGGTLVGVDGYAGATSTSTNFFALYRHFWDRMLPQAMK